MYIEGMLSVWFKTNIVASLLHHNPMINRQLFKFLQLTAWPMNPGA
jgi:hypothetical protein